MTRLLRVFAVCTLAAVILALHARHFDHVVDDAFISFRYLRHWLAGHGLVYNVGERVEGYTNFLWIVLLAPGATLGAPVPLLARVLGIACMAGAIALRAGLSGQVGEPHPLAGVVLVCLAGPVAYWAAGGLETGLFCLLVVVLLSVLWKAGTPRACVFAGIVAALVCMTRPDGAVYVAAGMLWLVFSTLHARAWTERATRAAAMGIAFAAAYGPYFFWRWLYYDALLPNTFYAKVGGGGAALPRGLAYVFAFVLASGVGSILLLGLVAVVLRAWRTAADATATAWRGLLGGFLAAGLLFVLLVGGDQLAMFRFMVPLVVIGLPASWGALAATVAPLVGARRRLVRRGFRFAAIGVAGAFLLAHSFFGPMARRVFASERPADRDREAIGTWLHEHEPPDTLIAAVPAGILPYYAQLPTLDLVGLNDRHIARAAVPGVGRGHAGHERYDPDYVLAREPDLVFLGACRLWEHPLPQGELEAYIRRYSTLAPGVGALLTHPQFRSRYAPQALPIAGRYAHVWVRRRPRSG